MGKRVVEGTSDGARPLRARELATVAAMNCREWTDPVMYARGEAPKMGLADRLRLLAQIDEVRKQRDEFSTRQDVDVDVRQGTLDAFDAEIRKLEDNLKSSKTRSRLRAKMRMDIEWATRLAQRVYGRKASGRRCLGRC